MPRRHRVRSTARVLGPLCGCATLFAGCGGSGRPLVAVPSIVGQDIGPATTTVANARLRLHIASAVNAAPADRVVQQDLPPGSQVKADAVITLTISSGPGPAVVPQEAGQKADAATAAIVAVGFHAAITKQASDTVTAGHVISTAPAALASASKASTVSIVVSSGPRTVPIPDVSHLQQGEATKKLNRLGLNVVVNQQPSAAPAGQVLSQTPAPKAHAKRDDAVTVTVAQAIPAVTAPSVVNQTLAAAVKTLSPLGLVIGLHSQTVTSTTKDGLVLTQRPAAGRSIARGGHFTLVVGKLSAPRPTVVTQPKRTGTQHQ